MAGTHTYIPTREEMARRPLLAQAITRARIDAGLTQDAVAMAAGTHQATWSRWESGEITPRDYTLVEIQKALGVALVVNGRHVTPLDHPSRDRWFPTAVFRLDAAPKEASNAVS